MKDQTPEAIRPWNSRGSEPALISEDVRPNNEGSREEAQTLEQMMCALEAERTRFGQQLEEIKAAQQHLLERSVGLEEQNSALTTLYVACQRLHSSLDRTELLLTVREIITNLIGCEEYILLTLGPDGLLRLADSFGRERTQYERLAPDSGLVWRVVQTGAAYLAGENGGSGARRGEAGLTACVPLKRNGVTTGVLALFHLLPQKSELEELDRELLRMLETHVAIALYCAELHERQTLSNGAVA